MANMKKLLVLLAFVPSLALAQQPTALPLPPAPPTINQVLTMEEQTIAKALADAASAHNLAAGLAAKVDELEKSVAALTAERDALKAKAK